MPRPPRDPVADFDCPSARVVRFAAVSYKITSMRSLGVVICLTLLLTYSALSQQPAAASKPADSASGGLSSSEQDKLKILLESKVRAEWEAFKNRDKKAYGDLLADDFVAVEADGDGARNKIHAVNEADSSTITRYSLFAFKIIPISPTSAIVTYELTMEFPRKVQVRIWRVWASELWLNRDGQWKARYYQETPVK